MGLFKKILICLFSLLALTEVSFAQQSKDDDLVQFSGIVITADSLRALPLVSIRIKGNNKGTYTDPGGFFSFVARKGDTVLFSSIGLRTATYVIPSSLKSYRYSVIQPMAEDTFYLPETVVRPWPTPEEFNYYFVKAKIPDEPLARARYNTRSDVLNRIGDNMSMDAIEAGNDYSRQQSNNYYYKGQLPPQRLFDPFAWNSFFNAWQRGDFKKKN